MSLYKITTASLLAVFLFGCEYTFTSEEEIESEILEITPIGLEENEARILIEEKFGADAFHSIGGAEPNVDNWNRSGWFRNGVVRDKSQPYFIMYKIGAHPSIYIVFPTYVYATWFFGGNSELQSVKVTKEIDAI